MPDRPRPHRDPERDLLWKGVAGRCARCGDPLDGMPSKDGMHAAPERNCHARVARQIDYRSIGVGSCYLYRWWRIWDLCSGRIEKDHVVELADNGRHDLVLPACRKHHLVKTTKSNRARNAAKRAAKDKTQKGHRMRRAAALLVLAVALADYARWWWLGQYAPWDQTAWAWKCALQAAAVVALVVAAWQIRARHTRLELIRIELANLADSPLTDTKLRTATWDGDQLARLDITFAKTSNVAFEADRVRFRNALSERYGGPWDCTWTGRAGRDRIRLTCVRVAPKPAQQADDPRRHDTRITDVVATELPGATSNVVARHDDGSPAVVHITVTAALARKAANSLTDVMDAMYSVLPPQGEWVLSRDARSDIITARDVPDPLVPIVKPVRPDHWDLFRKDAVLGAARVSTPGGDPVEAWRQQILGLSTFLAGNSGAGKASIQWGMISAALPYILQNRLRLTILNPKIQEFGILEAAADTNPMIRYAEDPDDIHDLLGDLRVELREDQRRLKGSRLRAITMDDLTVENPGMLVIADEWADITVYPPDNKMRADNIRNGSGMVTQCRAAGWGFHVALQDPRAETAKMRPLFMQSIGMYLPEADQTRQVLGATARARGALCDRIPLPNPDDPNGGGAGVAYVISQEAVGGTIIGTPRKVRAAWLNNTHVQAIADQLAAVQIGATP